MVSPIAKCSDEEFVGLFNHHGATKTSIMLKCTERNVYARRARLSKLFDAMMVAPSKQSTIKEYPHRATSSGI